MSKSMEKYYVRRTYAQDKLGGKCLRCADVKALEFDHIDPQKKTKNIPELLLGSLKRLDEELEKCQLLCRACHLQKTADEYERTGRTRVSELHGNISAYQNYSCRCEICLKWFSEYRKEYYRNHPWYERKTTGEVITVSTHGSRRFFEKLKCQCNTCCAARKKKYLQDSEYRRQRVKN